MSSDQGVSLALTHELPMAVGRKGALQALPQHFVRQHFPTRVKNGFDGDCPNTDWGIQIPVGKTIGTAVDKTNKTNQ